MAKRQKQGETKRRTLKQQGREEQKQAQIVDADALHRLKLGPCQYYDNGLRYGVIVSIPDKGKNHGQVRIEHPMNGRTWIGASDVRIL